MLAKEINKIIPKEDCAYFGQPCDDALKSDLIFVGFWTDKGCCDEMLPNFCQKLTGNKFFCSERSDSDSRKNTSTELSQKLRA